MADIRGLSPRERKLVQVRSLSPATGRIKMDPKKIKSMIDNRVECPEGGYPYHEARWSCDKCKRSINGLTCLDPECYGFIPRDAQVVE